MAVAQKLGLSTLPRSIYYEEISKAVHIKHEKIKCCVLLGKKTAKIYIKIMNFCMKITLTQYQLVRVVCMFPMVTLVDRV